MKEDRGQKEIEELEALRTYLLRCTTVPLDCRAMQVALMGISACYNCNRPRNMPNHKRYYAVIIGRKPGIYESWAECYSQVNGFSGNLYESFAVFEDACDFYMTNQVKESESLNENDISFNRVPNETNDEDHNDKKRKH
eukprot:scaffold14163_cov51-Attheya_sp.AAC.1